MKTKNLFYILLASGMVCLYSCTNMSNPADESRKTMETKNMETMQKVFDNFAAGNTNVDEWVSADMVERTPDPNIKATGLAGMKEAITMYHTSFPDMKINVSRMIADSDYVVAHFTMTGTNSGPMGPMPATNKSIDVNGVDIVRFENGKGVEHWGYWQETKMMQQLGLMPEQGHEMPMDTTKKM
jgi:steroid delta-isomerase-like uncharacterized protein